MDGKNTVNMKVQILRRKCCNTTYAGCIEPHCYTSKTWAKDLKLAVKDGDTIEVVAISKSNLEFCKCEKIPK